MRLIDGTYSIANICKVLFTAFLALCISHTPAHADDIDDAQQVAIRFLDKIGNSKFRSAWNEDISQWFKNKMTEEAFLGNMTITRAQLGGTGTGRQLVQRNTSNIPPGGELNGPIYSFMFTSTYPTAKIYEAVVLAKEDGEFRVTGFNYVPNPN